MSPATLPVPSAPVVPSVTGVAHAPPRPKSHAVDSADDRSKMASRGSPNWVRIACSIAALGALIALAFVLTPPSSASGEAPVKPSFRRLFVPADRPDQWPAGDWQPIESRELDELWRHATQRDAAPEQAQIARATYRATLQSEMLLGELDWECERRSSIAVPLALDPLDLPMTSLTWDDGPAIWGTAPDGRVQVLMDRPSGDLHGEWRAAGKPLGHSLHFELDLAPAVISRLVLTLPADRVLAAASGEVIEGPASDNGTREWSVELARHTKCRLTVSARIDRGPVPTLVLYRGELSFSVRPELVRVQADFQLEALDAPLREIEIDLGRDLETISVHYGELPAAWHELQTGNERKVSVVLPDAVQGNLLPIRWQGATRVTDHARWKLPEPLISAGHLLERQVTLRMHPPLQTLDVRLQGYRQVSRTAATGEAEVSVFRRALPRGEIELLIGTARLETLARVYTYLDATSETWTADTQIRWSARSGSVFQVQCRVPTEWEVTDVTLADPNSAADLTSWRVRTREGGAAWLELAFLDSLSAERPKQVRIESRCLKHESSVSLPVFVPADVADLESVIVAATGSAASLTTQAHATFRPLSLEAYLREHPEPGFPQDQLRADHAADLLLVSDHLQPMARTDRATTAGAPRPAPRPLPARRAAIAGRSGRRPAAAGAELVIEELHVGARLSLQARGVDAYQAQFRVAGNVRPGRLEWSLPDDASASECHVDGRPVTPVYLDRAWSVDLAPSRDPQWVTLDYRVPHPQQANSAERQLVLPRPSATLLRTRCTVWPEGGVRVTGGHPAFESLQAPGSWLDPLLAPLGQRTRGHRFRFWLANDWLTLLSPAQKDAAIETAPVPDQSPAWSMTVMGWPEQVGVRLCQSSTAAACAWAGLCLACLAGLLLRLGAAPRVRLVAWAMAAAALCAVWADPLTAHFAAGSFWGCGASLAVPRVWIRRRRPRLAVGGVPTGSTRSFAVATHTLLALVGWAGWAFLLDAHELTLPADPSADGLDVVVPALADGSRSGVKLVYVRREALAALRKAATPPLALPAYLLRSAAYQALLPDEGPMQMLAEFEVLVREGENRSVFLPLSNANVGGIDPCLVDGRPAPVLPGPEGTGLLIDMPVPSRSAGPETSASAPATRAGAGKTSVAVPAAHESGTGVATARPAPATGLTAGRAASLAPTPDQGSSAAKYRAHRIELKLHPPMEWDGGTIALQLGVPVICQTSLSWKSIRGLPTCEAIGARGGLVRGAQMTGTRLDAWMGKTPLLRLRWSTAPAPPPTPPELQMTFFRVVDLAPSSVQVRCRGEYRLAQGGVEYVTWRIPAGLALRNLKLPPGTLSRVKTEADRSSLIEFEFGAPQTEQFALEGTFVGPLDLSGASQPIHWPQLGVAAGDAASPAVLTAGTSHLAVRHPAEWTVELADEAGPLRPQPIDEFLRGLTVEGARPQAAYALGPRTLLKARLLAATPSLRVRGTLQHRFARDRADLVLTADLETHALSSFEYILQVDPRVRITAVTLREEGAARPIRWTRSGDQLIVLLTDRPNRPQRLLVEGVMPIHFEEEFDLPGLSFPAPALVDQEIVLSRREDMQVEIVEQEGVALTAHAPSGEPTYAESDGPRFVQTAAQARIRVRTRQCSPPLPVDLVTRIEPDAPGLRIVMSLAIDPQRAGRLDARVQLPGAWSHDVQVTAPMTIQAHREIQPDGSEHVALVSDVLTGDVAWCEIRSRWQFDGPSDQVLPRPRLLGLTLREDLLAIPAALVPAAIARLPLAQPAAQNFPSRWTARQTDATALAIHDIAHRAVPWGSPVSAAEECRVSSLETICGWDGTGSMRAETRFLVAETSAELLDVELPNAAEPLAWIVNGRRESPPQALGADRWRLAWPGGSTSGVGVLTWRLATQVATYRPYRVEWTLPRLDRGVVQQESVAFVSADPLARWNAPGLVRRPMPDVLQQRLDRARAQMAVGDGPARDDPARGREGSAERALARLSSETARDLHWLSRSHGTAREADREDGTPASIAPVSTMSPTRTWPLAEVPDVTVARESAFAVEPETLEGGGPRSRASGWCLPWRLTRFVHGLLWAMLTLVAVRLPARLQVWEAVQRRTWLALLLVGWLWWLVLQPSVVGALLMGAGLLSLVWQVWPQITARRARPA